MGIDKTTSLNYLIYGGFFSNSSFLFHQKYNHCNRTMALLVLYPAIFGAAEVVTTQLWRSQKNLQEHGYLSLLWN